MTTALAKACYLMVGDVLLLELPDVPEERRMDLAWEFTGFPAFWDYQGTEWHPSHTMRRQLRELRQPSVIQGDSR